MRKYRNLIIAVFGISIFAFSFKADNYFEITKNLDVFSSIFKELNAYYVDDFKNDELIEKGVNAMLKSLDPYTNYISEDEIGAFRTQTTGKYGGIGSIIRKIEDHIVIAEPYFGFPAQKAGLIAGDRIIAVDGKSMKGKTTTELSETLRGTPGTEVTIEIFRPIKKEELKFTLVREEVKVGAVPYYGMLNENVGYISLRSFTDNCSKELTAALNELESENELESLVFDLRGNPGGLLHEAVNVSNLFIDKGKLVVSTKGKVKEWERNYKTKNTPFNTKIPLVVLTNKSSASASEIVAGVLQDYDRGVVIGQNTFGKGLVQTTRNLSYNTKLKITTAKYYVPSGRSIQSVNYKNGKKSEVVADSLKAKFKTNKGRLVYDGGGVAPDIAIEKIPMHSITADILRKQLAFEYVNQFVSKNTSIASPREFELSDANYDEFVAYLKSEDFDYVSSSEKELTALIEQAEKEGYYDDIETQLTSLKGNIKHDKNQDLVKHKKEIKEYLERQIVKRYYYQKGAVEAGLDEDKEIKKALEILSDQARYNKLLLVQ